MSNEPVNRVILTIELPSGAVFDVWTRFVRVVKRGEYDRLSITGRSEASYFDTTCLFAKPRLPKLYLPLIREAWEKAELLPPGHVIHWVGDQNTIDSVCTCFGLPKAS